MRIDDFLSTVGIIKRRTIAKELASNGMIEVNGRRVKPAHEVKANDIIAIKGAQFVTLEVRAIPVGSIPKERRDEFVKILTSAS